MSHVYITLSLPFYSVCVNAILHDSWETLCWFSPTLYWLGRSCPRFCTGSGDVLLNIVLARDTFSRHFTGSPPSRCDFSQHSFYVGVKAAYCDAWNNTYQCVRSIVQARTLSTPPLLVFIPYRCGLFMCACLVF